MMNYTWLGPAIDIGLFLSLIFFGLRMVRSSGPRVNLGRMVELEAGLRALLREADTASRALNDHLLTRQKDLEKLLFDLETTSGRLNRQVTGAEEMKGKLELEISRAASMLRASGDYTSSREQERQRTPAQNDREGREENFSTGMRSSVARVTPDVRLEVESVPEVEPPSFAGVISPPLPLLRGTESHARVASSVEQSSLSARVEREIIPNREEHDRRVSRPSAVDRARAHQVPAIRVRPIESEIAISRELNGLRSDDIERPKSPIRSRAAAIEAQSERRPLVPSESRRPTFEPEEVDDSDRSSVLSAEEAARATGEDPRLGVLGAAPIRRQVQVL